MLHHGDSMTGSLCFRKTLLRAGAAYKKGSVCVLKLMRWPYLPARWLLEGHARACGEPTEHEHYLVSQLTLVPPVGVR